MPKTTDDRNGQQSKNNAKLFLRMNYKNWKAFQTDATGGLSVLWWTSIWSDYCAALCPTSIKRWHMNFHLVRLMRPTSIKWWYMNFHLVWLLCPTSIKQWYMNFHLVRLMRPTSIKRWYMNFHLVRLMRPTLFTNWWQSSSSEDQCT